MPRTTSGESVLSRGVRIVKATAVMSALARRVEATELAGTPQRHLNNTLRSWSSLPLRFTVA